MQRLARLIRRRLKDDRDLVIIVSGDEGQGKSRFILELGKAIDPRFTPQNNIAYRGKEIAEKFEKLNKYSVLDVDEAMKDFYKRGWMTKDRRKQNILFSRIREKNIATFLLIPNFWDIDPYYRNHRVRIWIHIPRRGIIIVSKKDDNPYALDKWHQRENEKIIRNMIFKKGHSSEQLIRAMSKTVNFVYGFTFTPTDEQIWQDYLNKKKEYIEEEDNLFAEEEKRESKFLKEWRMIAGVFAKELKKNGYPYTEQAKMVQGYGISREKDAIRRSIQELHRHVEIKKKIAKHDHTPILINTVVKSPENTS